MDEQPFSRLRLYLTGSVALAELAYLLWEHFNGGVASHHLLHRADMPAISNWWSLLLLPALTWFLTGRIQRRIAHHSGGEQAASRILGRVAAGFTGSLLLGILLSVSFTSGYESISSSLFLGMFLLALLLPAYRAECLLGFVLGMSLTFGAVIPTIVGSLLAAISALVHLYVRPGLASLWSWLRRSRRPAP